MQRTSLPAFALAALLALAVPAAAQTTSSAQKPKPAPSPPESRGTTLTKAEHGFSLQVPGGWQAVNDPGAAAFIARTDNADVVTLVFVQREKAPTDVTEMLANVLSKMKSSTEQKLLTHKFDVFLDRPALIAEYEDADTRFKTTIVPREYEDRSQVYYVVTAGAPKALFAKMAPAFDTIIAGFRILETMAAADARPGASPSAGAPGAAAASGKYTPPPGFDRAKVLERILAPQPVKPPGD